MTVQAFLSYAHEDEAGLKHLKQCLTTLKRQAFITDWSDHQITAGTSINGAIKTALENSQLFIALVSPDYIDSNYCWEKELNFALEQQQKDEMEVIPIIYRVCDWQNTNLSQIKCLPKDGKAIRSKNWFDEDEAWQNVTEQLRSSLQRKKQPTAPAPKAAPLSNTSLPNVSAATPSPSLPSLPKAFTDYEKQAFVKESFRIIIDFFENQISSLKNENNGWNASLKKKADDLAIVSLYLSGNLAFQISLSLPPEGLPLGFGSNAPSKTFLLGYCEGTLQPGMYRAYGGHFWLTNGSSSETANTPEWILKLYEAYSSLGWKPIENISSNFIPSSLEIPKTIPEEGFSTEEIAKIFWKFLLQRASDILKQQQNPYASRY